MRATGTGKVSFLEPEPQMGGFFDFVEDAWNAVAGVAEDFVDSDFFKAFTTNILPLIPGVGQMYGAYNNAIGPIMARMIQGESFADAVKNTGAEALGVFTGETPDVDAQVQAAAEEELRKQGHQVTPSPPPPPVKKVVKINAAALKALAKKPSFLSTTKMAFSPSTLATITKSAPSTSLVQRVAGDAMTGEGAPPPGDITPTAKPGPLANVDKTTLYAGAGVAVLALAGLAYYGHKKRWF
jgi:hypothetical protein